MQCSQCYHQINWHGSTSAELKPDQRTTCGSCDCSSFSIMLLLQPCIFIWGGGCVCVTPDHSPLGWDFSFNKNHSYCSSFTKHSMAHTQSSLGRKRETSECKHPLSTSETNKKCWFSAAQCLRGEINLNVKWGYSAASNLRNALCCWFNSTVWINNTDYTLVTVSFSYLGRFWRKNG